RITAPAQLPPRASGAGAKFTGGPPARSNLLSCWPEKKAMDLLSDDQNGNFPPSVPANGLAEALSNGRKKSICFCSETPTNTMLVPSGEIAGAPPMSPSVRSVRSEERRVGKEDEHRRRRYNKRILSIIV